MRGQLGRQRLLHPEGLGEVEVVDLHGDAGVAVPHVEIVARDGDVEGHVQGVEDEAENEDPEEAGLGGALLVEAADILTAEVKVDKMQLRS